MFLQLMISVFFLVTPPNKTHLREIPDQNWNIRTEKFLEKTVSNEVVSKIKNIKFLVSSFQLSYLKQSKWAYSFLSHDCMSAEQAKNLLLKIHHAITDEIKKNKDAIHYLYQNMEANDLDVEDISVKITFWTDKFDRIQPPYLAQIYYLNGKIYTNTSDPTQHLTESILLE